MVSLVFPSYAGCVTKAGYLADKSRPKAPKRMDSMLGIPVEPSCAGLMHVRYSTLSQLYDAPFLDCDAYIFLQDFWV